MSGFEIAWSVGVEASGDQVISMEQVVELADVVATMKGSAGGMGTNAYHATFLVYAEDRDRAIAKAKENFAIAVEKADLPRWEVTRVEAESEEDIEPEDGFP
ncbi:MAG TPA: hypothetical protein VFW71_09350 [Actinomycetota bacterium]|nr:hypothetical protein [Actinomycetota bacterium]